MILILSLILSFTNTLHAGVFSDGFIDQSGSMEGPVDSALVEQYKVAIRTGLRIDPKGECARILVAAEKRMNRPMTNKELEEAIVKIVARTGEVLKEMTFVPAPLPAPAPKPAPKPSKSDFESWNCFTAGMKVLTPFGERPIGELKAGDEVISLNMETRTWIKNPIAKVLITPEQKFGTLVGLKYPLEVTDSERFYTAGGEFLPLGTLTPDTTIFSPQILKSGRYELDPVQRGDYVKSPVCATVFNLTLQAEPRNFIVNGILVHNIHEKGI